MKKIIVFGLFMVMSVFLMSCVPRPGVAPISGQATATVVATSCNGDDVCEASTVSVDKAIVNGATTTELLTVNRDTTMAGDLTVSNSHLNIQNSSLEIFPSLGTLHNLRIFMNASAPGSAATITSHTDLVINSDSSSGALRIYGYTLRIANNQTKFERMGGPTNAYACFNTAGVLYRSTIPCS